MRQRNGVVISESTHADLISSGRQDPVTKQRFRGGDTVIACGHCKIIYKVDSWNLIGDKCLSCKNSGVSTRLEIPSNTEVLSLGTGSNAPPRQQRRSASSSLPFRIVDDATPSRTLQPSNNSNRVFRIIDDTSSGTQSSRQPPPLSSAMQAGARNEEEKKGFWEVVLHVLWVIVTNIAKFHVWLFQSLLKDSVGDLERIRPQWSLDYIRPLVVVVLITLYALFLFIVLLRLIF